VARGALSQEAFVSHRYNNEKCGIVHQRVVREAAVPGALGWRLIKQLPIAQPSIARLQIAFHQHCWYRR